MIIMNTYPLKYCQFILGALLFSLGYTNSYALTHLEVVSPLLIDPAPKYEILLAQASNEDEVKKKILIPGEEEEEEEEEEEPDCD